MNKIVKQFTEHLVKTDYVRKHTWMGIPILQYPTDLMVLQELIWKIKPKTIIECGVAFGGLTVFMASLLSSKFESGNNNSVYAIDINFRPDARKELHNSGQNNIKIINGSSIDLKTFIKINHRDPTIVVLDSNHIHTHVLAELKLYSPLVSVGSYIVVFDTAIEFFGHLDKNQDRPWGKGNNPWTAVQTFMKDNDEFVVDKEIEQKAIVTAAPGGWLRRIR